MEAREQRDLIKPLLSRMHCNKCKTSTTINFVDRGFQGMLMPSINACCSEFEQLIRKRLGIN